MPRTKSATNKRKKPKCTKGTACGYSCIAAGKVCNQPVPKDVAGDDLSAIPAKGKKSGVKKAAEQDADAIWGAAMGDKSKVAMSVIKEVDPLNLKLKKSDMGIDYPDDDLTVEGVAKLAQAAGVPKSVAIAMGNGLRAWVSVHYGRCSPLTFQPTDQIEEYYKKGKPTKVTKENVALLAGATAALKVLPPLKADDPELKRYSGYEAWDKKTLNRWVDIEAEDLDGFIKKYKKGETVTEDGMFGTSIHDEKTMPGSWSQTNVSYEIKPKLDGSGRGKYIEHLKAGREGEVLYVPGTKFKVSDVLIDEYEEYDVYEDKVVQKRKVKIKLEEA